MEIKIIYDVGNQKADTAYRYDIVYSNSKTKSAVDVFEKWIEAVSK